MKFNYSLHIVFLWVAALYNYAMAIYMFAYPTSNWYWARNTMVYACVYANAILHSVSLFLNLIKLVYSHQKIIFIFSQLLDMAVVIAKGVIHIVIAYEIKFHFTFMGLAWAALPIMFLTLCMGFEKDAKFMARASNWLKEEVGLKSE